MGKAPLGPPMSNWLAESSDCYHRADFGGSQESFALL
jgi:hypothetical protein